MFVCTRCHRDVETQGLFCPFCGAPAPQPDAEPTDPFIGKTIADKFFVNQLLGKGGMGQVYKATHITLDKPVALKMLNRSFLSDPSMVQRFHREARAASKLNHPNCINILDFGETEDGALYIAMEYLGGRSLSKLLTDEFPLGELRVVRIVGQILGALAEAHSAGIIHRDLKLSNVMVEARRDEPDFVKVLDFGIAKLTEPGAGGQQLTGTGIVCGTPGYMSPEQARGEELDARSDLYAVGVILYELLTGRLPFESETPMGFVAKHMTEIPVSPRARRPDLAIAPSLDGLVMRALAKSRDERPSSAVEFREQLFTCELSPVEAYPQPRAERSSTVVIEAVGAKPPSQPSGRVSPPAVRRFDSPHPPPPPPPRPPPAAGGGTIVTGTPDGRPTPAGRTPAPQATLRTPSPEPTLRTPSPQPTLRTPAPHPTQPPTARTPAPRTPAPTSAGRTPAPTPAPAAPRTPQPSPRAGAAALTSSKKGLLAGGAAAAVVVLAAVGWFVTRGTDQFAGGAKAPPPPAASGELKLKKDDGEPPAPALPKPTPTAAQIPAPAPAPTPTQASAPASTPAPRPTSAPPALAVPLPPPPKGLPQVKVEAPPRVARARAPAKKGSGAVEIVEGMHVLKIPGASSGQGILTMTASPWANVFLDGKDIGETPREARVGEGTYRVKLVHPTLGAREATVTVASGGRAVYNVNMAR